MAERELVGEEQVVTQLVEGDKAIIIITLACSNTSTGGFPTSGSIDAAVGTAKSIMQTLGCDVQATSSAIVVPDVEIAETDELIAKQHITIERIVQADT